jgi:hypothetical protein
MKFGKQLKIIFGLLLSLVLLAAFPVLAFAKDQRAKEYVLCKNQNEVRTLSVTMNEDKNCVARYSKLGTDEVIGQSKAPELCHNRIQQVENVLKSANYSCKKFSKAQLTVSAEVIQ